MTLHHAVVFVDHHCARILLFGPEHTTERKVNAHMHLKGAGEHHARSQQAFFGKVCDGLNGMAKVLVVGGKTGITDFKNHVHQHRPEVLPQIAGYALAEHPSGQELQALARQWFAPTPQQSGVAV